MKTLRELKKAAENKGLKYEINKWDPTIYHWEKDKTPNPDFMKIEIGIEYRPWTYIWFEAWVEKGKDDDDLLMSFRQTYNMTNGRVDKRFKRGWRVENQLFKEA